MFKFVLLILLISGVILKTCAELNVHDMINAYNTLYNEAVSTIQSPIKDKKTSDIYATTEDFAREYGYPVETHTVVTGDGYLLTVHRIPYSPKSPPAPRKKPVLMQHGLMGSSEHWLLMGPGKALGLLLADEGYDVWLNNARGNFYSKSHVNMSSADPKFWNFSFHENGVYDLPAVIDHILQVTDKQQLLFIGYSLGCNAFFVTASRLPEYNQKISLMVALAPVVYITKIRNVLAEISYRLFPAIYETLRSFGVHQWLPRTEGLQTLLGNICREGKPSLSFCLFLLFNGSGMREESFNKTMAHVFFSHAVAGDSFNTLTHIVQNYGLDRFQEFDPTRSLGRVTREYDLSRVTSPISIHYADKDAFLHPDGVAKLKKRLRNVVSTTLVPDPNASHLDFVFGIKAREYIYNDVIAVMKRFA